MGICGSKEQPDNPQRTVNRQQQPNQVNLQQEINEQYSSIFTIVSNKTSGNGIKKTYSYISRVSEGKLYKTRDEFWETRVEGKQEIWMVLRNVIETDEETGLIMLQAAEIQLIKNSLQSVYDSSGSKYDIPIFCINDPIKYDIPEIENKYQDKIVTVIIRSMKFGGEDLLVKVGTYDSVEVLKTLILEKYPQFKDVRLFHFGRELINDKTIGTYGIMDDTIITASLF